MRSAASGPGRTRTGASAAISPDRATRRPSPGEVATKRPPPSTRPMSPTTSHSGLTATSLPFASVPVHRTGRSVPTCTSAGASRSMAARGPGATRTSATPDSPPDVATTAPAPAVTAVSRPSAPMVPTPPVTVHAGVIGLSFPSASRPAASNARTEPDATSSRAGVTAMDANGPAVTRTWASTDRSSTAAAKATAPAAVPTNVPSASIRPPPPPDRRQAGSTATRLPAASTPVTANRCDEPAATVAAVGSRVRLVSAPGTTRTSAAPVTPPARATTRAGPTRSPVNPPPAAMRPTGDDNSQAGSTATRLPAASRPTAVKAMVVPAGTSAGAGLTSIDASGPGTTSISVDAATRPEATTSRAVPARSARKRPVPSISPTASDRLQVGVSGTGLPPAS